VEGADHDQRIRIQRNEGGSPADQRAGQGLWARLSGEGGAESSAEVHGPREARASGTNDKAGSKLNLVHRVSARTIKETFNPPRDYRYPFMAEE